MNKNTFTKVHQSIAIEKYKVIRRERLFKILYLLNVGGAILYFGTKYLTYLI